MSATPLKERSHYLRQLHQKWQLKNHLFTTADSVAGNKKPPHTSFVNVRPLDSIDTSTSRSSSYPWLLFELSDNSLFILIIPKSKTLKSFPMTNSMDHITLKTPTWGNSPWQFIKLHLSSSAPLIEDCVRLNHSTRRQPRTRRKEYKSRIIKIINFLLLLSH